MKAPRANGFVLPYVLVVIAILAVAGTIAANRLQSTIRTLSAITSAERSLRMIDTAEAEVTFALLGANTIKDGFDLNPLSPAQTEFGLTDARGLPIDQRDANAIKRDIWPVKRGLRKVQTPSGLVVVALQDVSGLPSLNDPRSAYLPAALEAAGLKRGDIPRLLIYLRDYIDADDDKTMGGAERPDYTLLKMAPPPNSPIRSFGELSRIMGWAEAMETLDMTRLKTLVTLNNVTDFRDSFMSEELKALPQVSAMLRRNNGPLTPNTGVSDLFALAGQNTTLPSKSVRIQFYAPRGNGQWDQRIVEFTRQTGHITKPYRRLWVLDTTVLESDLEFDPAQLAELEYVIDPASLRP